MVDLVTTSIIPLSIFVGLPILLWLLFMALRWYRGWRRPREWAKKRSASSARTLSDSLSASAEPRAASVRLSVSDLVAEGKRSTCAACQHDFWYEDGHLRKEISPRPWERHSQHGPEPPDQAEPPKVFRL